MNKNNDSKTPASKNITIKEIAAKGSIIAVIIAAPSLVAFFVALYILDDLLYAAVIGAVINFLAMGFSIKIAKKFFARKPKIDKQE